MKKQIKELSDQADQLHADNVKAVKDIVKIIDASKYRDTDDFQQAIAEQLHNGYDIKTAINSLVVMVRAGQRPGHTETMYVVDKKG
jgi:hypothetical protein